MVCLFLAEPVLSQHNLYNSNLIRILCDSLLKPYSFCNPLQFKMSCPLFDLLHMLFSAFCWFTECVPRISHWPLVWPFICAALHPRVFLYTLGILL